MIQGFPAQLIPGEVGSDITTASRPEISDLSLDQNFNNQSGINYVSLAVPGDISINRNIYSTVSLPQNIVGSIDQNQESLSSVYVHSGDHLLDKNLPLNQSYPQTVNNMLSLSSVVSHGPEPPMPLQEVPQLGTDSSDKLHILRSLKLSFSSRNYDSLLLSEIPLFLQEYVDLRKAYANVNKEEVFTDLPPAEDLMNPPISRIPQLLDEYKMMVQNMRKSYVCSTCHKSFTTRYSLNIHMSIHSNSKPYECPHPECGKFFRTKSALNTHINLTHTLAKDHVCPTCGKSYSKVWLLRQHELRHHLNHRYQCPKCDQSFTYPYQLKQHEITKHEGIKPFVCSFENCGKTFTSKSTLHLHELAHTRPFVCSVCYRQFGYACDLKRHKKKAHQMSE